MQMTDSEKTALQKEFLKSAGRNTEAFKRLFDALPNVLFHIADRQERIIAMNPRCLENCNAVRELDVVGETIPDLFPTVIAEVYMARDHEVLSTGQAIVNRVYSHCADRSTTLRIMNVWPLYDARGRIIGTAAAYTDAASTDSLPVWYGSIKEAVAFIDRHYAERLSLVQLAKIANVSETRFRRLFKNVMEMTPGRYIITIRLNAARRLLATTDMLISDIATQVGFWDQSHFVKTFKRERGLTPSEYRKRHWTL
jgi:AraC-like DNA-binding protein